MHNKLRCISNKKAKDLTQGKLYQANFISNEPLLVGNKKVPAVLITTDRGEIKWFEKNRFQQAKRET
jgi:hypothetical protein